MKNDVVYLLIDGEFIDVYGNLKTLCEAIRSERQYSTIWCGLKGSDVTQFGAYTIQRKKIHRAEYRQKSER